MGKKNRKSKVAKEQPFVSVCTPTYNRRPFIDSMIKCFMHQTYPRDRMEWIIIDDGTDKIGELVQHIPQVKYFAYEKKMSLGKKRNIMHAKSCGSILVYMDDDDYYPPERVSHAVEKLKATPAAMCAGSSEVHIYFKHIQKMVQFGPYGPNHSTAGTFAFRRELLKDHSYDDNAALAEEKAFLNNYTVPFVQLDTRKTILVFSHEHNTFDKRKLLENPHPQFVHDSPYTVDDFVKDREFKKFFMEDIGPALDDYEPGRPSMKPDVLAQIITIEEGRRKMLEEQMAAQAKAGQIMVHKEDGTSHKLDSQEAVRIMTQQQQQIAQLSTVLRERDNHIVTLQKKIVQLQRADQQKTTEHSGGFCMDDMVKQVNEEN